MSASYVLRFKPNNEVKPTAYPSAALRYAPGQAPAYLERWAAREINE